VDEEVDCPPMNKQEYELHSVAQHFPVISPSTSAVQLELHIIKFVGLTYIGKEFSIAMGLLTKTRLMDFPKFNLYSGTSSSIYRDIIRKRNYRSYNYLLWFMFVG
jgi:hypothetical protein